MPNTLSPTAVRVIRRGGRNSRVLLTDGTTRLIPNSMLSEIFNRTSGACEFFYTYGVELEFAILASDLDRCFEKFRAAGLDVYDNRHRYGQSSTTRFVICYDGSVHPKQGATRPVNDSWIGAELTTPIVRSEAEWEQLRQILVIINEAPSAHVNRSTGYHCHIGNINCTGRQVYYGYRQLENVFFDRLVPESRRASNNYYCKSCPSNVSSSDKYVKLSIRKFAMNGTVECRQHSGTLDYTKVRNWSRLLAKLVDWVNGHPTQAIPEGITFEGAVDLLGITGELRSWVIARREELR